MLFNGFLDLNYLMLAVQFGHTMHVCILQSHQLAPSVRTKWMQTKKNVTRRIVFNMLFFPLSQLLVSLAFHRKNQVVQQHWIINPFVYLDHGNTGYVYSVFCLYLNILPFVIRFQEQNSVDNFYYLLFYSTCRLFSFSLFL